ncbi:MAG: hypothetical protein AB7N53_09370 [Candidatus Binatia bacterium]
MANAPALLRALAVPLVFIATCAAALGAHQGREDAERQPPIPLAGAPAREALIDEFLDALARSDRDALQRLRVSKDEYIQIIVPGNVAPGQPPLQTFEKNNEVFWTLLDTRSRMFADVLLRDYGGKRYSVQSVQFSRPAQEHPWYTAHGELRLHLVSPEGKGFVLRSGWIAEANGRWKFIGYEWDD